MKINILTCLKCVKCRNGTRFGFIKYQSIGKWSKCQEDPPIFVNFDQKKCGFCQTSNDLVARKSRDGLVLSYFCIEIVKYQRPECAPWSPAPTPGVGGGFGVGTGVGHQADPGVSRNFPNFSLNFSILIVDICDGGFVKQKLHGSLGLLLWLEKNFMLEFHASKKSVKKEKIVKKNLSWFGTNYMECLERVEQRTVWSKSFAPRKGVGQLTNPQVRCIALYFYKENICWCWNLSALMGTWLVMLRSRMLYSKYEDLMSLNSHFKYENLTSSDLYFKYGYLTSLNPDYSEDLGYSFEYVTWKRVYDGKFNWVEGVRSIRNNIIKMLLLMQGVESNPGPGEAKDKKPNLTIRSYNCNGLGNLDKFRRVLIKVRDEVRKGGIVLLQETHIVDEKIIETYWKMKYSTSCVSTNSKGVIILYDDSWVIWEQTWDDEGRCTAIVIEKDFVKLLVVNVYCPTGDPVRSREFMEKVYDEIYRLLDKHPDSFVVLGGDFNACMEDNDSLNRNKSASESRLTEYIKINNKTCGLEDAYRTLEKEGGYTWSRDVCQSRLDYVFVSGYLTSRIKRVSINIAFEQSDHASLFIEMHIEEEIEVGPGLSRVNGAILDDPGTLLSAKSEVKEMMDQVPKDWDSHKKLEYLKVVIRTVVAGLVGLNRKELRNEIAELENDLNEMHELKVKACELEKSCKMTRKINLIESAINHIDNDLRTLRAKQSAETSFRTRARWYEHGEKSNKYFLNLNKKYKKTKLIGNIVCDNVTYRGQKDVSEGITGFYEKLYAQEEVEEEEDDFYANCPKLSQAFKENIEVELTMEDLLAALGTCTDSAPGPDGISYSVYKKLWEIAGPIMHEAWKHSYTIGIMPPSHRESVITLLPKEGKDVKDIKNWRPITLANCDSKIITKALSMRVSKVLEEILDPSQTAYVNGRSGADNLRSILFMRDHCVEEDLDSVLISLDARKAFDSVSHQYIENTLREYGFGPGFIRCFRVLYNEISAKVLVNGHLSRKIEIKRGVKQGDALSCVIFAICIDPLLRNMNSDPKIKMIELKTRLTKTEVKCKAGGYADDVYVVCKGDQESVQGIFDQYGRLTRRSGLVLNAEKTEILNLHTDRKRIYRVEYNRQEVKVVTVNELKICGIWYCNNLEREYKLNIRDKIDKLKSKIRLWKSRNLTFEGRSLIIKTFGLSQLIYGLQVYPLREESVKEIERCIFGFLWIGCKSTAERGVDRIKRAVLKNEYAEGGLNMTDIECLDKSLKLRQFIRAGRSSHPIRVIQQYCLEQLGYKDAVQQEYHSITKKEGVTRSAQITINDICDYTRESIKMDLERYVNNIIATNLIASINIRTYLLRQNKKLVQCLYTPLRNDGIEKLHELCTEEEIERERERLKRIRMVTVNFPVELIEIAGAYDENVNRDSLGLTHILMKDGSWK